MPTPNEYYVDPSIAGDSGAGTSGDPYGDLQYALDNITRDSTDGDRINIKAGTDEVLSAALDMTTYGSPSDPGRLTLQGYTTTAGDGGQGSIDCNSNSFFSAVNLNGIELIDLEIYGSGSADIIHLANDCAVIRCEVHETSGKGVDVSQRSRVSHSNIYDIGGVGITLGIYCVADANYLKNGPTNNFSSAISMPGQIGVVSRNIISVSGSSNGIVANADEKNEVRNNNILSSSGTGAGIDMNNQEIGLCLSNLIEGFSGVGGVGIVTAANEKTILLENNAAYNNTTNYSLSGVTLITASDNEALGASPFAKSGSDTFANRATYFESVDTGNVRGGAYPTELRLDKGAVQHADPAGGGGGGVKLAGFGGGMVG